MANTLATSTWVTKEVARGFLNTIKFIANINRTYDAQYKVSGANVGNTVLARLPQRFTVSDGQAMQIQNILDQTVPISLTNQKHVAFGYSSQQATTELNDIRKRYVEPAAEALGSSADALAFQAMYRDVYNCVGTLGTTPNTIQTYLDAGVKLTDLSCPDGGRVAVLDPKAMATISGATATLFNPGAAISENYRKGQFGSNQLGIGEWYQDQMVPVHTSGTFTASTPLVNGASQTGSSLITNGWASGATTLKRGDTLTIAGVYSVNPLSYQSTGRLQQFAVTADISDTTGDMTIGITPSIITSGQLQTVSNSPASGAAITVWSANPAAGTLSTTVSPQSLVYHPDFGAFVMADLAKPTAGCEATFVRSKQAGISIRMVEQYQIGTDQNPSRLDILIGAATVQARLACRVVG
jgi:hypothetical protein